MDFIYIHWGASLAPMAASTYFIRVIQAILPTEAHLG